MAAGLAFSQVAGRIAGQVEDSASAAIPHAAVRAENTGTGASLKVVADSQGRYVFALLPIGVYNVAAEAAGFQKQVKSGVQVTVAVALSVDFSLAVGQLSEVVEVNAQGRSSRRRRPAGL